MVDSSISRTWRTACECTQRSHGRVMAPDARQHDVAFNTSLEVSLSSTLRITNARAHDAIWRFVLRFSFMTSARKTQRCRDAVNSRYLQLGRCLMATGRRGDRCCLKSCKQVCPTRKTGSYCTSDDDTGESGSGDKARSTEPYRQNISLP